MNNRYKDSYSFCLSFLFPYQSDDAVLETLDESKAILVGIEALLPKLVCIVI